VTKGFSGQRVCLLEAALKAKAQQYRATLRAFAFEAGRFTREDTLAACMGLVQRCLMSAGRFIHA
jgi:hypothetical protein